MSVTTMTGSPLPTTLAVRELLEGMFGRDVDGKTGSGAVNPAAAPGAMVGVYTDDKLATRAIVIADLPLAAYGGAALALIPVRQAEEAIEAGLLPEALSENFGEVLNVAASWFNVEGAPHVKLYGTFQPGEVLPPDIQKWVLAFVRRLDLELAVAGYGSGRLSILAL
ncbi:MAG TPA: hypothetical protein PKB06_02640 [Actinotalea sp.]|nr:hypothetical protein [Actinotalea sp.]